MHYLLETARALQTHVRRTPLSPLVTPPPSEPALVRLRAACENALWEQEVRRMRDKKAADERVCVADLPPAPTIPRANQVPAGESWETTGEIRAIEILADVLARPQGSPRLSPASKRSEGSERRGRRPAGRVRLLTALPG